MRLDECHTITDLPKGRSWSLVIGGPRRRRWGFYLPTGYVDERTYDETVRANRRDMWAEVSVNSHAEQQPRDDASSTPLHPAPTDPAGDAT